MDILDLARRVKRGAALLNRRFPGWKLIMRRHADQFDLQDGDCCVLGTLEHRLGRLKVMAAKRARKADNGYTRAARALFGADRLRDGEDHGFIGPRDPNHEDSRYDRDANYDALEALWRAEFEATRQ